MGGPSLLLASLPPYKNQETPASMIEKLGTSHMRTRLIFFVLALLTMARTTVAQGAVVAMDLGPPSERTPSTESDWNSAVTIDRFFLANGEDTPVTPTSVSLVWNKTALFIRFRCEDPNAVYRDGVRLSRTDRVEVGLLAPDGQQQDLQEFIASEDGPASMRRAGHDAGWPDAKTARDSGGWTADLVIPWSAIGEVPTKPFRLQLSRVRQITGEVLSPSAVDFHDGPVDTPRAPAATDEFIEVTLGGNKRIQTADAGLITLPSGTRRWERRALLHHATVEECKQLAHLQEELKGVPTTEANLQDRIHLAEIWYDLLDQEGFSFHWDSGTWLPGGLDPWTARHQFNDALSAGNVDAACRILDSLLQRFEEVSLSWFADGTPGDVREDAWTPVSAIESAAVEDDELVLNARAAETEVKLYVSFPSVGGIRIHGPAKGFFAPASLQPIQLKSTPEKVQAIANNLTVEIEIKPDWRINVLDAGSQREIWSLRKGDLRIHRDAAGLIAGIDIRGDLKSGEKIFGLGERFDALDQRGETLTLWQMDAWDSTAWGGLSNQAYKPIPLWHSSSEYSIFWNTSYQIRADFGCNEADRYHLTAHGPILDLYIWPGNYQNVLREYTSLTGKPLLPPAWAFEPWMGGGGGRWAEEKWESPTQTMLDVVNRFQQLDIPHSSIYAEGEGSSDPLLYRKLEPLNIHVLTWGRSQAQGWSADQIRDALPKVSSEKLPLMRLANGEVYGFPPGHILSNQFPYIDFTNPKAMALLRAYWKQRLDFGVAGTMVDFADLVPRDALFYDGSNGEQMHNWYVHLYDHSIHEIFKERRGDDFILFARGAAPGTQVDAGQMAGDHASDFRGLDESLTGGLSLSTSGFSNWGSDVGGYLGKADEEVYLRWIEFGAFSPLMRFHGTEPREPWYYSDAAIGVYKKYAWLRENLLPYIYGSAQDVHATGLPLMRPLVSVASDEYMFGDELLVAPVHSPGEHRTISLPPGDWTDFWTGGPVKVGTTDTAVPLDQIPVFIRAGAVVPIEVAPDFELGESMSAGRVAALIVTPPGPERTLHNWTLPNEMEHVQLSSEKGEGGFDIIVANWSELQFILLSGLKGEMKSVTVDGQILPQLSLKEVESYPPGWQEIGHDRIIVRLPTALNHVVHFAVE